MPQVYLQRGDAETEPYWTLFQVFVGKDTVFEGTQGIKLSQITDGTSNTILVIEAEKAVPWSKPADLAYDPNQALPALGGMFKERFRFSSLAFEGSKYILALFADGFVYPIKKTIDEQNLRRLITRNDGEIPDSDQF